MVPLAPSGDHQLDATRMLAQELRVQAPGFGFANMISCPDVWPVNWWRWRIAGAAKAALKAARFPAGSWLLRHHGLRL